MNALTNLTFDAPISLPTTRTPTSQTVSPSEIMALVPTDVPVPTDETGSSADTKSTVVWQPTRTHDRLGPLDETQMHMGFFAGMPDDLLHKIFSYLNPETLIAMSYLCHGFYTEVSINYLGTCVARLFNNFKLMDGQGQPRLTPTPETCVYDPEGTRFRMWKVKVNFVERNAPQSPVSTKGTPQYEHPGFRVYPRTVWFISPDRDLLLRMPCAEGKGYLYPEDPIYEESDWDVQHDAHVNPHPLGTRAKIVGTKPYWEFATPDDLTPHDWVVLSDPQGFTPEESTFAACLARMNKEIEVDEDTGCLKWDAPIVGREAPGSAYQSKCMKSHAGILLPPYVGWRTLVHMGYIDDREWNGTVVAPATKREEYLDTFFDWRITGLLNPPSHLHWVENQDYTDRTAKIDLIDQVYQQPGRIEGFDFSVFA